MMDLVKDHCGVDFGAFETDEEARAAAKRKGLEITGKESRFLLLSRFFEEFVEEKLVQPLSCSSTPWRFLPGQA
jgi:lysyl-tRNA synthetase class 2